jgi:hypothetical protein
MKLCRLCLFDRNDDTATRCRQCGGDMASDDDDDDDDADSAWFHYLQIPNVGTVELVPGRAFNVGKEARNELVLPRSSAPQIAVLFWTDGYDEATLKETGADEVIKVDGVRIKGVRTLKGGEELELGALRMSYLKRATPVDDAIDASKVGPKGGTAGPRGVAQIDTAGAKINKRGRPLEPNVRQLGGAISQGTTPSPAGRGGALRPNERFTQSAPAPKGGSAGGGRAVGATPADVAVALEKTKASGTLRVKADTGRGFVTLVAGQPRYAAFAGLTGRPALDAILRLARGRCQVVKGASAERASGERIDVSFSAALAQVRAGAPKWGSAATRPAPRPGQPPQRPGQPPQRPGGPPPRR